eukprot:scaffold663820_cov51-Prasinocladus_malaysianus.AAC.1
MFDSFSLVLECAAQSPPSNTNVKLAGERPTTIPESTSASRGQPSSTSWTYGEIKPSDLAGPDGGALSPFLEACKTMRHLLGCVGICLLLLSLNEFVRARCSIRYIHAHRDLPA